MNRTVPRTCVSCRSGRTVRAVNPVRKLHRRFESYLARKYYYLLCMTITQCIKDNKQLLINTILSSTSKCDVFKKLNCHRNSFNIKKLNEFIEENNLCLSEREVKDGKVKCKYCGKEYTCTGISYHERYCKENPNREINYGNKGTTKGYNPWNKGKTKSDDNRIKQYGETFTRKVRSGEIIPYWRGKDIQKKLYRKLKSL